MRTHVANLAAAYTLTGREAYAEKAALLLQSFFLDEDTRMNPHLTYAQAIPICTSRGIGIIHTLHLIDVPMAGCKLAASPSLPPQLLQGLKRWFADYLQWMYSHPYGVEERSTSNNH